MQVSLEQKRRRRKRYKFLKKVEKAQSLRVKLMRITNESMIYEVRGERKHTVNISKMGRSDDCDCSNGLSPCSHVIAVRIFRGEKQWTEKK